MRKRIDYCRSCENGWIMRGKMYCVLNRENKGLFARCPDFSDRTRPSPSSTAGFEWPGDRTAVIAATASVTLAILVLLPL